MTTYFLKETANCGIENIEYFSSYATHDLDKVISSKTRCPIAM
jgi:hypothetical protein